MGLKWDPRSIGPVAHLAQMVFTDPPYNVPIDGYVCGLGAIKHENFKMASGEMTEIQFTDFLRGVFENLARFSLDGSMHFAGTIATKGATFQAKPNRVVVNNTDVLALFAEHNLVLALQGHLHVSERLRWRSTTFITGGAVSGKWWRGPYFGTEEGFNAITFRRDRVEWEYLDYGWRARRPAGK